MDKTCTFNNGKKPLSNTTCRIFVNRLAAALTKAVSEGLIDRNPFKLLDAKEKPQKNSSIREFLTIEDVKLLMATPCRYEIVKRALLFSCFRGLRYSDIKTLLWSEIRKAADGKILYLEHPQVKTKKIVTVPLSDTTVEVILSPLLSSLKFILTQINSYQVRMAIMFNKHYLLRPLSSFRFV